MSLHGPALAPTRRSGCGPVRGLVCPHVLKLHIVHVFGKCISKYLSCCLCVSVCVCVSTHNNYTLMRVCGSGCTLSSPFLLCSCINPFIHSLIHSFIHLKNIY